MEDFYKKYNINIQNNKTYKFNIVRYYPKISTYEFINVGILLYDNNSIYYRLVKPEEIHKFHCSSMINYKVLKNSLNSLEEFLQNNISANNVLQKITNRYKNILDTSFQLVYSGQEKPNELIKKLFYDYIGYKFDIEQKKDKLSEIIKSTKKLVEKEFKIIEVKKSKIKGYDLDFINKKTKAIHHSLLGSIENSEHVARAFLKAPSIFKQNEFYNFLNIRQHLSNQAEDNKRKLQKIDISFYNYTNKEEILSYCKNLL